MLKKKQKSVSDQLNELINPTPVHFDPEEDLHADTAAKIVENEYDEDWLEDSTVSKYRQQNVELIEEVDERYLGKKVSRKSTIQSSESEDEGKEQFSDSEKEPLADSSEAESESGDDLEDGSDGKEEDEYDEDNDDNDIVQGGNKDESFQHVSGCKGNEVEKGQAIRNQLGLWDQLLEARIRLQKCVSLANRLPQPDTLPSFKKEGGTDFVALLNQTKQSTTNLLQKLVDLRTERLRTFSETKNIYSSKKRDKTHTDGDEEITSSEDDEKMEEKDDEPSRKRIRPDDFSTLLTEQHNEFTEYRNITIQKWNDKTRVAIGNVNSRNFSAFEQSTLRQIEQILANRPRLVARTQLKRSNYRVFGKAPTVNMDNNREGGTQRLESAKELQKPDILEDKSKERDAEIFDDDDFYHQLLRELIERKTVDITDPVQLGRQWLELQKIRSKMKRKVDLRATKGRKLRFTVHQKLVNFMAPVMLSDWTEEAKTDLFNSLFGKTMESTRQEK